MGKKLYVGNLAWQVTSEELAAHFEPIGTVLSAAVIIDRNTGRSRGFGFVEMDSPEQAQKAIQELNNTRIQGRQIMVRDAKPETKGNNTEVRDVDPMPITRIQEFVKLAEVGEEIPFQANFKNFVIIREN